MDEVDRENIEIQEQKLRGGRPDPGWEKMERAARQVDQQVEQNPPFEEGFTEHVDVPEDERLSRPVGTETDSY